MNEARTYHGQLYRPIGEFERRRKDGTMAVIITWASECAECGEGFLFTTPARSDKFQPNRRCPRHKRPGQRVRTA